VERQVPGFRPGLLARPAGHAAGVRVPAVWLQRPVRDQRPPPGRLDQLRYLPRRLHPGRPGQLQLQAHSKHNEANGERNTDGTDDNRSWNCGAEGPTDDAEITALRARQARNFLVTLFCAQGVPMLLAGDELGRTQGGNNNAYCQDNEVSWVDWADAAKHAGLLEFTRGLAELRRAHPVFRRRRFFSGQVAADGLRDITWLAPSGAAMGDGNWGDSQLKAIGVFLNGDAITEPGPRGDVVRDQSFLLLFNARAQAQPFRLPGPAYAARWEPVVDTSALDALAPEAGYPAEATVEVASRAVLVLRAASAG
jgi:isoamylase